MNEKNNHNSGTDCRTKTGDECCKKVSSFEQNNLPTQIRKNLSQLLVAFLVIVAILNLFIMGLFALSVNGKLDQVIAATKPLEVAMMLVVPADCPACGDLAAYKKQIQAQNIELTEDVIFSSDSEKGKSLVEAYSLQRLPALILTTQNPIEKKVLSSLPQGAVAVSENVLVWEQSAPPYYNVGAGKIDGLVSVTYLIDSSCVDCYDVEDVQRPILQRLGIAIATENMIDVQTSEGTSLVDSYNVEAVPTIILSPEARDYAALQNVWGQVGTVEPDGTHVFREMSVLGVTYKVVKTGDVLFPRVE